MISDNEKRYSILDIYLVIKRRILIVAICFAICAAGALSFTKIFMDKEYTATVIMYAAPNKTVIQANPQTSLSELNYLQKIVISYIEVLKTETFLDSVAKQINLGFNAEQLQKMVTFNVINQTEYFELQVISGNPNDSLAIADAISQLAPVIISEINIDDTLRVLNPARLPAGPSGPSLLKNILAGAAAGLFLGVILAFILDKRDKHIKDKNDLLKRYNIPVLGHVMIPNRKLEPMLGANALANEKYKELLTNLLSEKNSESQKIILTSPEPNMAKSTNCYNLGIMLAKATTAKVLIIDCDYRRTDPQNEADLNDSAMYLYFKINQVPGLSQMLSSKNIHSRLINKTDIPNLDIIYRGNVPLNPADILGSSAMKELLDTLPAHYNYILIDTPALNANPDALALSRYVDSVILVVMQGKTTYQDIGLAISRFSINNLKITGMILDTYKNPGDTHQDGI
jgi:polysaccharide biosynthesis transport protein